MTIISIIAIAEIIVLTTTAVDISLWPLVAIVTLRLSLLRVYAVTGTVIATTAAWFLRSSLRLNSNLFRDWIKNLR